MNSFVEALCADGPAPDLAEKMMLYGRFVGRWEMEAFVPGPAGLAPAGHGEIHFAWALQGRAVQDVWIMPSRMARREGAESPVRFYGTTLRIYDPGLDGWHILWSDPEKQFYTRQIGRAEGDDIVQIGQDLNDVRWRWSFRDITADSFRWRAERAEGHGWNLVVEFRAWRVKG
jgi:hypothetical protein